MEALQADIARQINKRSYPVSDSESDLDHPQRVRKRARCAHKSRPYISRSHVPPTAGPDTEVSSSAASSSMLVCDNDKQSLSLAPSEASFPDDSSNKESLPWDSESQPESVSDEINERAESSTLLHTASSLSTLLDSESHSSDDSDDLGECHDEHKEAEPTVINIPYSQLGRTLSIYVHGGDVSVDGVPVSRDHSRNDTKSMSPNDDDETSPSSSDTGSPSLGSDTDSFSSSESNSNSDNDASENTGDAGTSSLVSDIDTSFSESKSNSDATSDSVPPSEIRAATRNVASTYQRFRSEAQSYPATTSPSFTRQDPSLLKARLETLLPRMRAANEELEVEKREGRLGERDIERLGDGEKAHIEMDLGLGVLEKKKEVKEKLDVYGVANGGDSDDLDPVESTEERTLPALLPNRGIRDRVGIELVEDKL